VGLYSPLASSKEPKTTTSRQITCAPTTYTAPPSPPPPPNRITTNTYLGGLRVGAVLLYTYGAQCISRCLKIWPHNLTQIRRGKQTQKKKKRKGVFLWWTHWLGPHSILKPLSLACCDINKWGDKVLVLCFYLTNLLQSTEDFVSHLGHHPLKFY